MPDLKLLNNGLGLCVGLFLDILTIIFIHVELKKKFTTTLKKLKSALNAIERNFVYT